MVVTNLSEVMGIFSDILSKSRFEQRPIPGNFSPRPNPKKNTTKGTKPISLTKEFKPVPGTYNYRRDPDSTAKPKGKTAERELISDGATSDDATFVEGLEKADAAENARRLNTEAKEGADFDREYYGTMKREGLGQDGDLQDFGSARHMYQSEGAMDKDPEITRHTSALRRESAKVGRREYQRELGQTRAGEHSMNMQKAVYEYLHKNRRPIRQKPNQEKLKELLDAGEISQEGYDGLMSGKRGSARAVAQQWRRDNPKSPLEAAQDRADRRKGTGVDIHVSESAERSKKYRTEGYPKSGTDYRTGKKPAAEEDKPHVDTQGKFDLGMLKAFGVMKAESREGTYTPADYKSKNTVDSVVRRSQRKSGFNPPPTGNQNLQVRSPRVNVDEETYEDVDTKTKIRDESYQSGRPQANILSRRGGSATGYAHHTADTGPTQGFMDVGATGASAKPTGRTAIAARDEDRSRGKNLKYKRGPQSGASDTGLGIRESEDKRKKEQAALSTEERAKTPLQRLQEADRKRALSQKQILIKAFGIMKASFHTWKHGFGQPQIEDEDEHGYATAPPGSYYTSQSEPMEFHHGLQMGTGNPKLGQTREERGARTPKAVLASRKGKPARHKNYAAVQRRKKAEAQQAGESTTPAQTGTTDSKPVEAMLKAFGVMKAPTSEENARKLNRQNELERTYEATRVEEERQKRYPHGDKPRATDEMLAHEVAGETHLYDSERAIRSSPATKNQEASLRRHGFPERRDQRKGQRLIDESTGKQVFGDLPGLPSVEESTDDYVKQYKKKQQQKVTNRSKEKYGDWDKPGQSAIQNLKKAHMLKAFGVMKSTGGRHGLHPVERRPKTVTEKADGGEEYSSGARGRTPALLGMAKALADGMSPERRQRILDKVGNVASRYDEFAPKKPENPKKSPQRELPFSTEDRDNIAPTPDPHGDNLPEPKQRGGTRQGSKRHGEIPKEGWKEAALLYPAHRKEQQGGRKVKTRVGDSTGGYPT